MSSPAGDPTPATAPGTLLERLARHVPGLLFQFEVRFAGDPGRFLYVSERGGQLFGLQVAQVLADVNVLFDAILVEDRRRMLQALLEATATLREWRCDFRAHRGDGALRWMLGTATPERQPGGRVVWHGYVEDITERREVEQARQEAAVAAAANRAKTEFLSRMSHELRTPLNAVLGFTQLMEVDRSEPPGEGQRRRLRLIRDAGVHLLHMITDMLDLTRIESGMLTLQAEDIPLRAMVADTVEMLREGAEQLQVSLQLLPGEPFTVHADRTRLRQVLLNLVGNAIKYNRPGGRVEIAVLRGDDGHAELRIADTGLGIAEADLPHVFEPFHRGSQAAGKIDGAGIGLTVTRALVGLMGGRIDVVSRLGAGSTFSVWLPLRQSST